MLGSRPDEFPAEAVRDLLGLVRAMWLAERSGGRDSRKLDKLERVGRLLDEAYAMGRTYDEGTVGWRAAWAKAETAARLVADCVEITDAGKPVVLAACRRVARNA